MYKQELYINNLIIFIYVCISCFKIWYWICGIYQTIKLNTIKNEILSSRPFSFTRH
jgi:hypothetical protein